MLRWLRAVPCLVLLNAAACVEGGRPPEGDSPLASDPTSPPASDPGHPPTPDPTIVPASDVQPDLGECGDSGACWVHGAPIHAVHAAADGTAFAVGADGLIAEWTEAGWQRHRGVVSGDVLDVFVAGRDDVWITTQDADVLRYDGERWEPQAVMGTRLTGTAADDVWIDMQHYDGADFIDRTPAPLYVFDVLATEPGVAWMIGLPMDGQGSVDGGGAVVYRENGGRCKQVGQRLPLAFSGAGRLLVEQGEVWIYNTLLAMRFDGASWVEVPGVMQQGEWTFPELASGPETRVLHDGQRFASVPASTGCTSLTSAGSGRALCTGPAGRLFHADDERWLRTSYDGFGDTLGPEHWGRVPPALWAGDATLAWGAGPNVVLRVRPGAAEGDEAALDVLERYDGASWSELATGHFSDLDGSSATDMWIAGDQLQYYDGHALEVWPTPPELGALTFSAVHVVSPASRFIVAHRAADQASLLLHHGHGFTLELTQIETGHDPIGLEDIAGASDDDLWLLATRGPFTKVPSSILLRLDATGWRTIDLSDNGFTHLLSDGEQLWLSGTSGVRAVAIESLAAPTSLPLAQLSPLTAGALLPLWGRPWLGPSDLWLTTAEQAMRLPR